MKKNVKILSLVMAFLMLLSTAIMTVFADLLWKEMLTLDISNGMWKKSI